MTNLRAVHVVMCALAAALLCGCPPSAGNVCAKLQQNAAASSGVASPELVAECHKRLGALESGEYGACSQCIMNAVDSTKLAGCRSLCPGLESMLPVAPSK